MFAGDLPRYDWRRSYQWNYDHPPEVAHLDVPQVEGDWEYCGLAVDSPIGIPAGPLLNGQWCLYYASLGYDVLTYKTVRSRSRDCYPLPNLQPVHCPSLRGGEQSLPAQERMLGSWAVSFGMPSKDPVAWRQDIENTRKALPKGKLLSVSVVGTMQPGWSIDDLALDYAQCARWAVDSGADAIEANLSCPNVSTCDGQLYHAPQSAAMVAQAVREAAGQTPVVLKIGHTTDDDAASELVAAIGDRADALAMTNSVAATVADAQGRLLFDGQPRGICGAAIRTASIEQVAHFTELIRSHKARLKIIGVGGASTAADICTYLQAGAHAVHFATAAMINPGLAATLKRELRPAELQAPSQDGPSLE